MTQNAARSTVALAQGIKHREIVRGEVGIEQLESKRIAKSLNRFLRSSPVPSLSVSGTRRSNNKALNPCPFEVANLCVSLKRYLLSPSS